jgi:hypothetical protein
MILNRYRLFTSAQSALHRGVSRQELSGAVGLVLCVSTMLIQKRRRWLAVRMRSCRPLGPVRSATAAYGPTVADDIFLTAPDGGLMVMISPVSGWPWILAALGVVIVVLGGLLL